MGSVLRAGIHPDQRFQFVEKC